MEIHLEGQHTTIEAAQQEWIRERLVELNTPHEDIVHARVTLVKHERHHKGSDEAVLLLTLSGKTIRVERTADTLDDALYQMFDVATRELHEFRLMRQHTAKTPGPRPRGRIVRLFADRDYGFIETESHREVYFHANSVHGMPFKELQVGMAVDLDIESGHAGPQASRVTPRYP